MKLQRRKPDEPPIEIRVTVPAEIVSRPQGLLPLLRGHLRRAHRAPGRHRRDPAALPSRRSRLPPLAPPARAAGRRARQVIASLSAPSAVRDVPSSLDRRRSRGRSRSDPRGSSWAEPCRSAFQPPSSLAMLAADRGSCRVLSFGVIRLRAGCARALRTRRRALVSEDSARSRPLPRAPARLTPNPPRLSLRWRPPAPGPVRPGLRVGRETWPRGASNPTKETHHGSQHPGTLRCRTARGDGEGLLDPHRYRLPEPRRQLEPALRLPAHRPDRDRPDAAGDVRAGGAADPKAAGASRSAK